MDGYQVKAIESFIEGRNVCITGPAGSGKSFLLRAIVSHCQRNGITEAVTATTGVAALLVGGRTFHSFFGFGVASGTPEEMWRIVAKKRTVLRGLRETRVLFVEEVSMLSADQFEAASFVAQQARRSALPFGGLRVVLCGDFAQLPPVQGRPCFEAPAWPALDFVHCTLRQAHRQTVDTRFLRLLEHIRRHSTLTDEYTAMLQARVMPEDPVQRPVTWLCARRDEAAVINDRNMQALDAGTEQTYRATYEWRGKKRPLRADTIEKTYDDASVTPPTLSLRVGALVMLTFNVSIERQLANGSLGRVVETSPSSVRVRFFRSGETVAIQPNTWTYDDRETCTQLRWTQIPLLPAWALTIHKSQGSTLDRIRLRLTNRIFAAGMTYVALSRVRSLDDVELDEFQASLVIPPHPARSVGAPVFVADQ